MDLHYPPAETPATVEYVLAVLRDLFPEIDPSHTLSFATTVEDWAEDYLLDLRKIGPGLNRWLDMDCTEAEWRNVLEPADEKRLWDVCDLIASYLWQPHVRPARLLGAACRTAGAFLTVRSLLHEAGVRVSEIGPSTPLAPYMRHHLEVFLGPISRLAPGSLPELEICRPVLDASLFGFTGGLLIAMISSCAGVHLLSAGAFVVAIACYAICWVDGHYPPASARFGAIRTFRDLAIVLADYHPED